MNREQRRQTVRQQSKVRRDFKYINQEETDFSSVPLATICQSIQLLINELRSRGYPVYDFDNKEKSVQGIRIIKNRVFFLAAKEVEDEKLQTGKGV